MAKAPRAGDKTTVREWLGLMTTVLLTAGLLADIIIYSQPGAKFSLPIAAAILLVPAGAPWLAYPYLKGATKSGSRAQPALSDGSHLLGSKAISHGRLAWLKRSVLVALAVVLAVLGGVGLALGILAQGTR